MRTISRGNSQFVNLAARVSGLVLIVWYTDSCISGAANIRAITALEMKGN